MYLNLRPTVCYYQTLVNKLSIHVFFLQSKWPDSQRKSNICDAHRGNRDMYIASDEWFGPAICVRPWFSGYTLTIYMNCIYSCGWVTLMCIAVACNLPSMDQYGPLFGWLNAHNDLTYSCPECPGFLSHAVKSLCWQACESSPHTLQ